MAKKRKKRGDREWTPEQRESLAKRQQEMHAVYAAFVEGREKKTTDGKPLTVARLEAFLKKLKKSGLKASTPVIIYPSAYQSAEICFEQSTENNAGVLVIR